jgi:hypothetical protein
MPDGEIPGTTKIAPRWRMTLIESVREAFAERGVEFEVGDQVVYRRRGDSIVTEHQKSDGGDGS